MIDSKFGFVCDHQLKQVLRKIVTNDLFDEYCAKMFNLEKSQDVLLNFFEDLCKKFSIPNDQAVSYCFIVKHISDNYLINLRTKEENQSELEIKKIIENENIRKQKEKENLDVELEHIYITYKQTKEERDQIIQDFKLNESNWSKIPFKIDKKKFRLYSDLLYVIEDLQRSINKL